MKRLRIIASVIGLPILLALGGCGGSGGGGGGGSGAASLAPGSLDTSFGANGIVTTPIGNGGAYANAMALQGDGKIVAAGYFFNGTNTDFAVARYNANGSLDTGFGPNGTGVVTTPIGGSYDYANAIAIQSDGKIVVAGYFGIISQYHMALARYNPDGSLDTSFGTNGIATTLIDSESSAHAIAIQSDGKIVVAGYSYNRTDTDFTLVRYNANGSRDNGFGTIGIVVTPLTGANVANAMVIQSDGKIVVAGHSGAGANADFALARYNANGSIDTNFGASGIVTTPIGSTDVATALVIQGDGKIIAAGYATLFGADEYALARYDTDGKPDTSFGTNGIAVTPVSLGGSVRDVVIQHDGKIVVTGEATESNKDNFALVRFKTDGNLDTSFGTNGIVITPIGDAAGARAIALQTDGKIVAAGYAGNNGDFAVARYNP